MGNSTVWFAASSVRNMPVAVGSQQDGQDPVVSPLVWDMTVPDAASLVGVGVTEAVSAGSVLGGRDSILTGTGMGAYGFGTDIFGAASPVTWGSNTTAAAGSGLPGLPADVGLTDQGALATVGGELMGARLYDPVTAGFLSPDPVEPVAGSGYMGASYLFASGDPVNLHDPTGLQPIPIEAMRKYTDYIKSDQFEHDLEEAVRKELGRKWDDFISVDEWKKSIEELQKDPGKWAGNHYKDIIAGLMLATGIAALFVPGAQGVGAAIVTSMVFSALVQKWETGRIDPSQLTFDGFIGGITGFGTILYLQRLEKLQSAGGVALRLEATQMSINAPRLASKGPKKFSFQDFFAGGFFKSQEKAPLTGLYRDGAEGARTVNELRHLRYPKVEIEVKPVAGAGGARSATEIPPVAVSRVDVPQVAPVEGSGASRGASQVPVKPVEAPQVGEVPPASGAGSGAAGMQAVKPGGVADDAVAARGSAGGVREPEVQLKPVEEPKVENLPPAKGAGAAEGQTVSMRDVQTHLDEKLEGVRRKEWRGKDKKGRPRTDYYDYDKYIEEDNKYLDLKRKIKEYEVDKKQAELEGREFTEAPPEDPGPRPQHALWKGAEERFAPDLQTAMQLDEEGLKHHRVVRSEDYQGQIPQDTAEHLQQATQKIMKDGAPPHYPGANEGRKFENHPMDGEGVGDILPTTDVEGNPITYTEMDFMAPQPKIGENGENELKPNGKPETTRGDDRLVVGSNGSIYYSPDHYHTFILIVE